MTSRQEKDPTQSGDLAVAGPARLARLGVVVIVLLIFVTPVAGFFWLRTMSRRAVEGAVLAHVRSMLIRHYARTGGAWPGSWDDLAEDFEPADANFDTPSLEAMQDLIAIDFDADLPALLSPESEPAEPPRLVWLRDRDTPAVRTTNERLVEGLCKRYEAHLRRQTKKRQPPDNNDDASGG